MGSQRELVRERRRPGPARKPSRAAISRGCRREPARSVRRASLHQRDELIRRAAARFCTGKARARAGELLAAANRYAATGWRMDHGCVSCPERLRGTVQELLWPLVADVTGKGVEPTP
jgi:hypothetical protein